ncbi:MAG TPA: DUF6158 family protein [Streptosporangiaceae bacterium]|nr:DUF6158 family protein [Streptosporangiaceae bacterium]
MSEEHGVPASELTDAELERQGVHAHATRHWIFLHGTAEQFRTHTQRMLELEEEYLRRHPQRTWQGSGGAGTGGRAISAVARDAHIRDLIRTLSSEVLALLDDQAGTAAAQAGAPAAAQDAQAKLLAAFAAAPGGALHKLEAHQVARQLAPNARLVASLYKQDPPLLRADGDQRIITDAGRAWLAAQSAQ